MINSYKKGRRFEYKVRDYLISKGFFVVRQAKSAFPDLLAINKGICHAIECKVNKYLSKKEKEGLAKLYKEHRIFPWLAYQKKEGRKSVIKLERAYGIFKS